MNPAHGTEIKTESCESVGNFTPSSEVIPPFDFDGPAHVSLLAVDNVDSNSSLQCALGSLRVHGMQGGEWDWSIGRPLPAHQF